MTNFTDIIQKGNFLLLILLISSQAFSQTDDEWQCGVSLYTTLQSLIETITPVIDDTFKVGLLLVQFSDWQSNPDARGGILGGRGGGPLPAWDPVNCLLGEEAGMIYALPKAIPAAFPALPCTSAPFEEPQSAVI